MLVTNQLHLMPEVDRIIVMKNGRICEQGSFSDLSSRVDGEFHRLYEELAQQSKDDESSGEVLKPEEKSPEAEKIASLEVFKKPSLARAGSMFMKGKLERGQSSLEISAPDHALSKADKKMELKKSMEEDLKEQQKKDVGKLVSNEGVSTGSVQWKVYQGYARAVGWLTFLFMLITFVAGHGLQILSSLWLSVWSSAGTARVHHPVTYYIGIYVALSLVGILFLF